MAMWIDDTFPDLAIKGYTVTSDRSEAYNCIAWAVGDRSAWWSHATGYRWRNAARTPLIESLVEVFVWLGFETCDGATLEEGFEKVALYALGVLWRHAARQLPNGLWTSKLGPDEDIQHATPEALCGDKYGNVHCIMRRQQHAETTAEAQ